MQPQASTGMQDALSVQWRPERPKRPSRWTAVRLWVFMSSRHPFKAVAYSRQIPNAYLVTTEGWPKKQLLRPFALNDRKPQGLVTLI